MTWILIKLMDGETVYWTGRRRQGRPEWTLWKHQAKHFTTPRCAYEAADTHQGMEDWRAVRRAGEKQQEIACS